MRSAVNNNWRPNVQLNPDVITNIQPNGRYEIRDGQCSFSLQLNFSISNQSVIPDVLEIRLLLPAEITHRVSIPSSDNIVFNLSGGEVVSKRITRGEVVLSIRPTRTMISDVSFSYIFDRDVVSEYVPENIQHLKLTKSKSAIVPVAWNIEASADTIRLVREEAEIIRRNFLRNGVNAVQTVELQYLNEQATGYDTVFAQKFYPERTEVWGDFVEFGLFLNERQKWWEDKCEADLSIDKTSETVSFPSMRLYNTVSATGVGVQSPAGVLMQSMMFKDRNSVIHDNNVSALSNVRPFPFLTIRKDIDELESVSGNLNIIADWIGTGTPATQLRVLVGIRHRRIDQNGNYGAYSSINWEIVLEGEQWDTRHGSVSKHYSVLMPDVLNESSAIEYEVLFALNNRIVSWGYWSVGVEFGFFLNANTPEFTAPYIPIEKVFEKQFGAGNFNYVKRPFERTGNVGYGILSGDMITGVEGAKATIKPLQFMKDWCKIMGYTFYFDRNDIAQIIPLENRFQMGGGNVLRISENVKDVQFRYSQDLIFAGVEVGYNSPSIDYPLFRQQFTEKITYLPNQRGGSDMFNLVVDSLRVDYAGLLLQYFDFINQPQRGDNLQQYKDVWLVQIDQRPQQHVPFTQRVTTNLLGGGEFNVYFSPRRMLQRYLRYFGTIFGVWNTNPHLEKQAEENISNEMISSMPHLDGSNNLSEKQEIVPLAGFDYTPMEIRFTTLANFRDVSILQDIVVEYDGREYPAIVCNVVTTERLEEVEITAYLRNGAA